MVNFQTHNQAPWDALNTVQSVVWRFNTYVGDYRVPAQIHRYWMEDAFQPWRLADMPSWVRDIGLVIMVGSPDLMGRELDMASTLAEEVDPSKTLLYLVDWCEYRYATYLPDYTPSEGFGDFIRAVHDLGYRVMLHTNLVGISTYHPLYAEFQQYQFRNPSDGRLMGWRWNELDEPRRHAWINNASSKFRDLLVSRLKQVWEEHGVDAFHLDISHVVTNDANGLIEGLNSRQGNVLMHKQLAEAMPGVVFSGEHLHEVTFFRESFAQRWKQWQGFTPHPISSFLFGPYTRPYGYLGLPTVSGERDAEYHLYLDSYESWGVLPTLWSWDLQLHRRPYAPLTQEILAVARQWQDLGLRPDFESDWEVDTLFQYVTRDGETVTYQRTPAGSAFLLPNDAGYERGFGVTQVQTHRSLPHWRAYNETTLLGLDPNRYYFLDNAPRDFSQVRVNSLSPDVYVSETRVTDHAVLFRFESTASNQQTTIGFFLPTPPVGSIPDTLRHIGSGHYTVEADLSQPVAIFLAPFSQINLPYNLIDAQFTAGLQFDNIFRLGSVYRSGSRTTVENPNGERKPSISAHPPTNGQTILQFPLHLPQSQGLTLSFSMVLQDNPCSNGVLFQVLLNGQNRFEHLIESPNWVDADLSLSEFAGQTVLLELVTDPNGSNSCDWAHWVDLLITVDESELAGDVNGDGQVNVLDLILVAGSFGQKPPSNPRTDVNNDGQVNILDLVFVAEHLSQNAAAPSQLALIKSIPSSTKEVIAAQRALTELEAMPNKSRGVQIAIELLRHYLSIADQNVKETKLLPNYPNPFNPETWIPYQLSEGSTVTVKIYDVTGSLMRTIEVGHKPGGYYLTRERAVYWDGRNHNGEAVSSGVYFYTLNTDTDTQTRRMVIVK